MSAGWRDPEGACDVLRDTAILILVALLNLVGPARAHMGHKALAVRGITVSTGALELTTQAEENIGIQLAPVRKETLEESIRLPCRAAVPVENRAVVTSRVQGKVARLAVRTGDHVTVGQELVEMDSLQIQTTAFELARTARELALARTNLARARALLGPGLAPQKEVLELQVSAIKLEIAVVGLESKLALLGMRPADIASARAGDTVGRIVLVSPIDGIVIDFPASKGKEVLTGTVLVEVADSRRLMVEGTVTEGMLREVREGAPVRVRFSSLPGETFLGSIDLVGKALDEATRCLTVYAPVDNVGGRVHPEMFGEMEVVTRSARGAFACPAKALVQVGADTLVLAKTRGKYWVHPVEVGLRTTDTVEIVTGIGPGFQVVVAGNHELATFFAPEELTVSPRAARNLGLAWAEVEYGPIETVLTAPAFVEIPPSQRFFASSRVAGRIERVMVRPGMTVKVGQTLALVRSVEADGLVVDHRRAVATEKYLADATRRTRALVEQKVVATRDLFTFESELAVASGEVENLRRRLQSLGIDLAAGATLVPILSPTSGEVHHSEIELGGHVEPDRHLVEVIDPARIWVEGDLPESEAAAVHPGQVARMRFTAYPDQVRDAKVLLLEPRIDRGHRAAHVVVEVPRDARMPLRSGMLGQLTLVAGGGAPTIRIPRSALMSDAGENAVFLEDEGTYRRVRVHTGRQDDRNVEVLDGVYPGEHVVIRGVEALRTAATAVR